MNLPDIGAFLFFGCPIIHEAIQVIAREAMKIPMPRFQFFKNSSLITDPEKIAYKYARDIMMPFEKSVGIG